MGTKATFRYAAPNFQVSVDVFFAAFPYVVVLVSFVVFCLLEGAENLTADRIFVSLALFNIVKFLFMLFPSSLMDAIRYEYTSSVYCN